MAVIRNQGPTALILTRQNIPLMDINNLGSPSGLQRGGYILWESNHSPQIILISTGSEVHLALEAGIVLQGKGISVRVVSLPSWNLFDQQPDEYKNSVLPPQIKKRISIEAGTSIGWERYVGLDGKSIGIDSFGISAPGSLVYDHFNITAKQVIDTALNIL
jgi:transketolase